VSRGGLTIGLISDTHGLLRPEALAEMDGSDHIVHAGDIGSVEVLETLGRIAPLTAIRGNNDTQAWARGLKETQTIDLAGVRIHVIHDLAELSGDPAERGIHVVVSGHSHIPRIADAGPHLDGASKPGVLYVNPGSAGPRRFRLPVSVGRLVLAKGQVTAQIVELAVAPPKRGASRR
jgi:putative phosphoesterase